MLFSKLYRHIDMSRSNFLYQEALSLPGTPHNLDTVEQEERDSARRIRAWSNNDSGNTQLRRLDGSGRPRTTHNLNQPTPEVVREENDAAKRMNAVNNYGETPSKKTAEQYNPQYSPRAPRYTQPDTL